MVRLVRGWFVDESVRYMSFGGVVFEMVVAVSGGVDEAMFGCCGRKLCTCVHRLEVRRRLMR
jgi:hypothetical protein